MWRTVTRVFPIVKVSPSFKRFGIESVARAAFVARENLGRIDSRAQFTRAAHEIGVDVRFKNVRDRNLLLARQLDILLDIRRRIENRRDARAVVAE